MNYWKEKIRQHQVFAELDDLLDKLNYEEPFTDEKTKGAIERLIKVLEKATKILSGADETFIANVHLDNLLSYIQSIKPQFTGLINQRSNVSAQAPHRGNIETYTDSILVTLSQIRGIVAPISQNSVFEKLGYIKINADAKLQEIEKALEKQITESKENLTNLETKTTELSDSIRDEKIRADNLITQFQSEFSDGQKERDDKFIKKFEKEFAPKINNQVTESKRQFEALKTEIDTKLIQLADDSDAIMATLNNHTNKAGLVAQAIAQKAIQTEYEETARIERKDANIWKWITLGISVVMIAVIGITLYFTVILNQPASIETLLPKFLLTAILVGVARWTAKLQKNHLEESRKFKRLSLELHTIAPFIATLEEKDQRQITIQLVDRFFIGKSHDSSNNGHSSPSDDDAFKFPTESLAEVINKINPTK